MIWGKEIKDGECARCGKTLTIDHQCPFTVTSHLKRTPPGFRRPDCCSKCRAFHGNCEFYNIGTAHPDEWVCSDFREEE